VGEGRGIPIEGNALEEKSFYAAKITGGTGLEKKNQKRKERSSGVEINIRDVTERR